APYLQRVRQSALAAETQHQVIAGAELVVGWYGAGDERQKLRRAALEHVDPEHGTTPPSCALARGGVDEPGVYRERLDLHRHRRQAERLNRRDLLQSGRRLRLSGCGTAQVRVEQCRRIARRLQPRPD